MIAMQYSIELPADYDMAIIERRVREKGRVFDDVSGLGIKAFLAARRGDRSNARVNLYAPFYVWTNPSAVMDFVCGDRFAGLTDSYGWPIVRTWAVFDARASAPFTCATAATREIERLRPFEHLERRREAEIERLQNTLEQGALFAVAGLDTSCWEIVRFSLWDRAPESRHGIDSYEVLHVSAPQDVLPFIHKTNGSRDG